MTGGQDYQLRAMYCFMCLLALFSYSPILLIPIKTEINKRITQLFTILIIYYLQKRVMIEFGIQFALFKSDRRIQDNEST